MPVELRADSGGIAVLATLSASKTTFSAAITHRLLSLIKSIRGRREGVLARFIRCHIFLPLRSWHTRNAHTRTQPRDISLSFFLFVQKDQFLFVLLATSSPSSTPPGPPGALSPFNVASEGADKRGRNDPGFLPVRRLIKAGGLHKRASNSVYSSPFCVDALKRPVIVRKSLFSPPRSQVFQTRPAAEITACCRPVRARLWLTGDGDVKMSRREGEASWRWYYNIHTLCVYMSKVWPLNWTSSFILMAADWHCGDWPRASTRRINNTYGVTERTIK